MAQPTTPTTAPTPIPTKAVKVRSVEGIEEYRLANGLQILLAPDDSKPTTTAQHHSSASSTSRHENDGETGMARSAPAPSVQGLTSVSETAWAEFSKRGLRANGTTNIDRTNYYASLSANVQPALVSVMGRGRHGELLQPPKPISTAK
jgi:zinc protease